MRADRRASEAKLKQVNIQYTKYTTYKIRNKQNEDKEKHLTKKKKKIII